jgi:hypothetical protein
MTLRRITTKTAGGIVLALALTLGVTACAGDKALFPETSYKEVNAAQIELTKPVTFDGTEIPEGSQVSFRFSLFTRKINRIVVAKDLTVQGVTIPAKSEAVVETSGDHLVVKSVTLGADADYKTLSFKAKDEVTFDNEGGVSQAFINGSRTFDGKSYPAQTALWFRDGSVTRTETQADRDRAAGERRACQANCAPLQGMPYTDCMNKCSMM